jgi:hypothetical protein
MNRLAKWILRGWSLICLIGLAVSLAHTIPTPRHAIDNDERELATIAIALGAAKWTGVWAIVLVPIGILHLMSNGKTPPDQQLS